MSVTDTRREQIFPVLSAAQVEAIKRLIPLGRAGTPEEAAGAVLLFCLPESDYVSGEIVVAAGGLRM